MSKKTGVSRGTRAVLICSLVLLGALLAVPLAASNSHSPVSRTTLGPPPSAPFDHIVTIMMENQGLCDVYTGCGGSAQYMSSLANANTLVLTWGTIGHHSEPNYIALMGGFDNTSTNNDGVCCFFENQNNIVDRIEGAGLTWTAWAEDSSGSGCPNTDGSFSNGGFHPPRNGDHFPFIDFTDMNTVSRCSHFQTTASSTDDTFINSLTTAASNFIWLTPNDNDNGHDTGVSGGDTYLSNLVPRILSSPLFNSTGSKATLLILYDEGYTPCSSNTGGTRECLYASFSGPATKKGVQISPAGASHYSYLSTIEAAWGLSSLNSNDAGAPNMLGAFGACTSNCPTGGTFLGLSDSTWLIMIGGVIGFVASLALLTVRRRAKSKHVTRTMTNLVTSP